VNACDVGDGFGLDSRNLHPIEPGPVRSGFAMGVAQTFTVMESRHPPTARVDGGSMVVRRLRESELFREYQQGFEALTGLPLVLRESGSFRTPLEGSTRVNPFCVLMHERNKSCAACLELQKRIEKEATQEPKTVQCYAGLSESAVPVRVGDNVLGYLQTGQVLFRAPSKKNFKAITRLAAGGAAETEAGPFASAYYQSHVVTKRQYQAIVRLLAIFADHLAAVSNRMLIRGAIAESHTITKGRTFIAEHYREKLYLGDVARAASVSAFYFCKVFKRATGLTFTRYLARERIESAKHILLDAHIRVSEAAFATGFQSISQFNRHFFRIAGESPSSYRKRLRAVNGKSAHHPELICVA
jgi:AraC-like DNA-binding protein/ligand-binding sensor protein